MLDKHDNIPQNNQKTNEETSKYLQQKNEKYTVAKINDVKALNVDSKKNKTLLRWEKITANWKMKQTKQSGQLITETAIQNLPSVNNLDSLDLSNTDIYENKKKNLFNKFTKKKISIKAWKEKSLLSKNCTWNCILYFIILLLYTFLYIKERIFKYLQ